MDCALAGEPQARYGEARNEILQDNDRGVQRMAKEKKTRILNVKMTEQEYEELEKVAGHYKKSDYVRKAIKVQMASDRIREKVTD